MEKGSSEGHPPGTTPNDKAEAVIKLIGPGETCLRVARFCWRLAWPFIKRRPWLSAWLAFVVVSSVTPCLFLCLVYEPDGHGAWVVGGGGIYRWSVTRAQGAQMGEPESMLQWYPSLANSVFFSWRSYNAVPSAPQQAVWIVGGPLWPFLLAPTLVAMGVVCTRRFRHQRRLHRALAAGRKPCPACGYDATGLETCPECGAAIEAVLAEQIPLS